MMGFFLTGRANVACEYNNKHLKWSEKPYSFIELAGDDSASWLIIALATLNMLACYIGHRLPSLSMTYVCTTEKS